MMKTEVTVIPHRLLDLSDKWPASHFLATDRTSVFAVDRSAYYVQPGAQTCHVCTERGRRAQTCQPCLDVLTAGDW